MMNPPEIEQQIQELDDWIKSNHDGREVKRALAVKLARKGWSYSPIKHSLSAFGTSLTPLTSPKVS